MTYAVGNPSVNIGIDLLAQTDEAAVLLRRSRSSIVREALEEWLKENRKHLAGLRAVRDQEAKAS